MNRGRDHSADHGSPHWLHHVEANATRPECRNEARENAHLIAETFRCRAPEICRFWHIDRHPNGVP